MTKTYNEIIKAIGELEMPFKEDVTKNIYTSWRDTICGNDIDCCAYVPELSRYSIEDLLALKWLIEEQIKVKEKEDK